MTEVEPRLKSGKKKRKKSERTRLTERCDTLFSLIVRSPGFCIECGTSEWLQCAHGFSRRYRAIRWDERNAWPLCRRCHKRYTEAPVEWDEWMRERLAPEVYDELRHSALHGGEPDLRDTLAELKTRWSEIEDAA